MAGLARLADSASDVQVGATSDQDVPAEAVVVALGSLMGSCQVP